MIDGNSGIADRFDSPAPASRLTLVLLAAAIIICAVAVNLWFIPSRVWEPLWRGSGGLVQPTLLGALLYLIVQVGLVLFVAGRVRPRDIGLDPAKLPAGALCAGAVWCATQALAMAMTIAGVPAPGRGLGRGGLCGCVRGLAHPESTHEGALR